MDALPYSALAVGAVAGLVAAFWSKLKALGDRALGLVVVRVQATHSALDALEMYLWRHGTRSSHGTRTYVAGPKFVRPLRRVVDVVWEAVGLNAPVVFWLGRCPVMVWVEYPSSGQNSLGRRLWAAFPRWSLAADELLSAAMSEFNDHNAGRIGRFRILRESGSLGRSKDNGPAWDMGGSTARDGRYLDWAEDQLGHAALANPLDKLALEPDAAALVDECRTWLVSEDWYRERALPWRLGWLLHGPPGTGKTSLARAVAASCDMPLVVLDLATMTDDDLQQAWKKALGLSPCVVLIEDMDAVYEGRRLVPDQGPSFGCLLNCLDGAEQAEGVLVVATTNRAESVDPALTRPGRLGRVVKMDVLSEGARRVLARRLLADFPDAVEATVAAGAGETGAQFQSRCADIALAARPLGPAKEGE